MLSREFQWTQNHKVPKNHLKKNTAEKTAPPVLNCVPGTCSKITAKSDYKSGETLANTSSEVATNRTKTKNQHFSKGQKGAKMRHHLFKVLWSDIRAKGIDDQHLATILLQDPNPVVHTYCVLHVLYCDSETVKNTLLALSTPASLMCWRALPI